MKAATTAKMFGTGLALSPDGKLLATCGSRCQQKREDITPARMFRKELRTRLFWNGPRTARRSTVSRKLRPKKFVLTGTDMAFSPNGRYLAAMRRNQLLGAPAKDQEAAAIAIWNIETPREPRILHVIEIAETAARAGSPLLARTAVGWPIDREQSRSLSGAWRKTQRSSRLSCLTSFWDGEPSTPKINGWLFRVARSDPNRGTS